MRPRKLQIFVSSTYEDLIDYRLAAMEAILAAGHIPAAMEQFSPGDETAWETIKRWIDDSDAFILILGGRYGSIEPDSGKSYVQLEYEYAKAQEKPYFALFITDKHLNERVNMLTLDKADERTHPELYRNFKKTVTEKLCRPFSSGQEIQMAIFQKLPEWMRNPDLVGWVKGNEARNPDLDRELAKLLEENRELRLKVSQQVEIFHGLYFDELVNSLRLERACMVFQNGWENKDEQKEIERLAESKGALAEMYFKNMKHRHIEVDFTPPAPQTPLRMRMVKYENPRRIFIEGPLRHAGDVFERLQRYLAGTGISFWVEETPWPLLNALIEYGLCDVSVYEESGWKYNKFIFSNEGRRFRNRLLVSGDFEYRERHFWSVDAQENASDNSA